MRRARPWIPQFARRSTVETRPEAPRDNLAIREVHREVLGGSQEGRLGDNPREAGYVRFPLIAEEDNRIVGHVILSEAGIRTEGTEVGALGPGVGSALIGGGLARCKAAGCRTVVLVGDPASYSRLGFSADKARNLSSRYSSEAFMAPELSPDALSGVS